MNLRLMRRNDDVYVPYPADVLRNPSSSELATLTVVKMNTEGREGVMGGHKMKNSMDNFSIDNHLYKTRPVIIENSHILLTR